MLKKIYPSKKKKNNIPFLLYFYSKNKNPNDSDIIESLRFHQKNYILKIILL